MRQLRAEIGFTITFIRITDLVKMSQRCLYKPYKADL